MAIKWSKEQLQAIHESGKSILVNAGAGSGKTAVLTQRLLEKVLSGVPLKNLIVLTFTKLAASEMKERLRKALLAAEKTKEITEAINYIDQANIQTFDAFTSEIVSKYHYLLNISKHNTIGDAVFLSIKKKKIIDDIFENLYQSDNQAFLDFIKTYSIKDDASIKDSVLKLYDKMVVDANYKDVLNNYYEYTCNNFFNLTFNSFVQMLQRKVEKAKTYLPYLKNIASTEPLLFSHYSELEPLVLELSKSKNYQDFVSINNITFPRLPSSKAIDIEQKALYKFYYDQLKGVYGEISDKVIYPSEKDVYKMYGSSLANLQVLVEILIELDKRYDEYKMTNNIFEFNDIALLAIRVFEENPDICAYYKNNINEILIDEYQDTSDIQETLISYIANNNVYMVGDIKQSIYRFRNANPQIFNQTYHKLENSENGLVINLSNNFRSRSQVLESINKIFSSMMSEFVGGVTYDERHQLSFGFRKYDEIDSRNYDMKILTYDDTHPSLASKHYTRTEAEIFIIAKDILSKVGKVQVYDPKLGETRLAQYSDFAILVQTKSKFDLYKKVFEYFMIPLDIRKDSDLTTNEEVYTIYNILELICYIDQDNIEIVKSGLTGFLRSFLVNADDKTIAQIILSDDIISKFQELLPEIYQSLMNIVSKKQVLTFPEIIRAIYEEFSVYEHIYLLDDVAQSEKRLEMLEVTVSSLTKVLNSLEELVDYFKQIINQSNYNITYQDFNSSDARTVKMMTIHASKGLEFPICYFPEQRQKFNFTDLNDAFIYSQKNKIIISLENGKLLYNHYLKAIESDQYHLEEISEKIRLFYVALTRAREEIIIVCPTFTDPVEAPELNMRVSSKSFYDLLKSIDRSIIDPYIKNIAIEELGLNKNYLTKATIEYESYNDSKLKFVDYSLKKQQLIQKKASKESIHIKSAAEYKVLELGEQFHKLLELIDFTKDVKSQISKFTLENSQRVLNFFESDFFKSLEIVETYHEYEFIDIVDDQELHGIVDLIIETPDQLIVIDYKLSNIDDPEYIKQVNTYKGFLEKHTKKQVVGYLYSINKNYFKEV